MIAKEKKLERQVEIWALLGPFIMIMTLTVILIKPTHHQLYIPLAALIGIPVCWKWKLPGLAVSLGILSALIVYQFIYSSHEVIFWDFILGIAVALTFGITALSYKEIDFVLKHLQTESSARLQSFLKADERIKSLETKHEYDLAIQVSKTGILQENLSEKTKQLQTYEQIVASARDELLHTLRQNEALQQEVFNKRHELALLEQQYVETHQLDSDTKELSDRIEQISVEKEASNNSLGHLQKEFDSLKALEAEKSLKLQEYSTMIQQLNESLSLNEQELAQYRQKSEELIVVYTKKEKSLTDQLGNMLSEKEGAEKTITSLQHEKKQLQDKLDHTPKASLEEIQALKRMEGMYNQLREQFKEKCLTLDETRRELFLVQEELLKLQRDTDEERRFSLNENESAVASLVKKMDEELSEIKYDRQENEALHKLIHQLTESSLIKTESPLRELPETVQTISEEPEIETKKKPKKAPAKKKETQKQTKTKDWASTIMSRWSDKEKDEG